MKNYFILSLLFLSVGLCQRLSEVIETYHNGNIKSITYHKKTGNGIEKVKEERYYENGQKKFEGLIKNGDSTGVWISWYDNGLKEKEGTFKDGKQDGLWTHWYENGKKSYEGTFKDGKQDGLGIYWYENGKKSYEGTFKDGELIKEKLY